MMKNCNGLEVTYCQECPHYSTGRDEMQEICGLGINLSKAVWNDNGEIIIPSDCPLPEAIAKNVEKKKPWIVNRQATHTNWTNYKSELEGALFDSVEVNPEHSRKVIRMPVPLVSTSYIIFVNGVMLLQGVDFTEVNTLIYFDFEIKPTDCIRFSGTAVSDTILVTKEDMNNLIWEVSGEVRQVQTFAIIAKTKEEAEQKFIDHFKEKVPYGYTYVDTMKTKIRR
jgi:hypothetical protein